MTDANTIMLDGPEVYEEGILDTAALPGMNIVLGTDGNFDPGADAAEGNISRIVIEDALQGKTVSQTYAIADRVRYIIPRKGQRVAVLVLDGQTVTKGSLLVANAAGKYIVETAEGVATFEAIEAAAPSGSDALVAVRAI